MKKTSISSARITSTSFKTRITRAIHKGAEFHSPNLQASASVLDTPLQISIECCCLKPEEVC